MLNFIVKVEGVTHNHARSLYILYIIYIFLPQKGFYFIYYLFLQTSLSPNIGH